MPKTTTTRRRPVRGAVPDDYLDLVRRFPLRPIRSAAEYDAAAVVLDRLAVRGEDGLTAGERDYLDALTAFVEWYDDEHHPTTATAEPLELVRELMAQRGMSVTALGALFGSKGVASEILSGKRPMTLATIGKLATHFRVDSAVFLPRASARRRPGDQTPKPE